MQEFQEAINGIYAHILVVTLYMLPRGKSGKKKKKKVTLTTSYTCTPVCKLKKGEVNQTMYGITTRTKHLGS